MAILTTKQVADRITQSPLIPGNVEWWQIVRLFETGELPEPPKFSGRRVIQEEELPAIVAALRRRGYLPIPEELAV